MFEKSYNKINVNNALNEAVLNADLNKIKSLFSQDDVPYVDHEINGVAVILYAAQHKNWDIVEELYNNEANLDVKVPYMDWYLIHECVKTAPDKVTKAVIEYSNINVQTKNGKTPLMVAITESKIDMANYIVSLGTSDLSIVDSNYENAAHYAAKNKQYDLFLSLVEKGVPLNQENRDGKIPSDLIEDISFKENLPKIVAKIKTLEPIKEEKVKDEKIVEELKPKVKGLSSIKRK